MMQGYIRDIVSIQLGWTNHVYKIGTRVMVEICCSGRIDKHTWKIQCKTRKWNRLQQQKLNEDKIVVQK